MINRAVVDMEPLVVDDQPVKRPTWHGEYCIGPGGGERLVRATFGDPDWDPIAALGSTVSAASERASWQSAGKNENQNTHTSAQTATPPAATPVCLNDVDQGTHDANSTYPVPKPCLTSQMSPVGSSIANASQKSQLRG